MNVAEYKRRYEGQDDAAPGWDAIDSRLRVAYPGQEPKHWGTRRSTTTKKPLAANTADLI
jgi:hypothetical protein